MLNRMRFVAEFDRHVEPDKHYISPGGYSIKTSNGKEIRFDFYHYEGTRISDNAVAFECCNLDTETYHESEVLSKESVDGCKFVEFTVYTGEYDDAEIICTNIRDVVFIFSDGEEIPYQKSIKNIIAA